MRRAVDRHMRRSRARGAMAALRGLPRRAGSSLAFAARLVAHAVLFVAHAAARGFHAIVRARLVRGGRRARAAAQRLRAPALGVQAVAECEAFLSGHLVEQVYTRATPVPVWAWTNLLAHGSPAELRRAARDLQGGATPSPGWRRARAYLAGELLDAVSAELPLATIQRDALVPLELDLAARDAVNAWDPSHLVTAVHLAIRDCGRSHRV